MQNRVKHVLINTFALFVSVLPPIIATLSYFSLWSDARSLSGLCLILLIISLVPLLRRIKIELKSASMPVIWGCIFVIFLLFSSIAKEMCVISLIGFISNLLGAILYRIARRYKDNEQ